VSRLRILLVTRSNTVADAVVDCLQGHPQYSVTKKIISNGHTDPLHDIRSRPDVLLLQYVRGNPELVHLADSAIESRLPLIVLGPADDPVAMRLAMQAGASDYLSQPLQQDDLHSALDRINERRADKPSDQGQIVTVMNSKGGSGASFVATNLAYELSHTVKARAVLVDFDLQFGGLSRYLDLYPKRGLVEALDATEDMDEVSAEAYITNHTSGVRLLAASTNRLFLSREAPIEQVDSLLQLLQNNNEYVIADLPRRIDLLSATVLEHSDQILIVVQQTLGHLNDAARTIKLVTKELAVPMDRIRVVLNRYSKNALIEKVDVKNALKVDRITVIPNQYKLVSESVDSGVPLMEVARNSAIGKAIQNLQQLVSGKDDEESTKRILGRKLPSFLGKH
jgi:pilus assembly protein CpaE